MYNFKYTSHICAVSIFYFLLLLLCALFIYSCLPFLFSSLLAFLFLPVSYLIPCPPTSDLQIAVAALKSSRPVPRPLGGRCRATLCGTSSIPISNVYVASFRAITTDVYPQLKHLNDHKASLLTLTTTFERISDNTTLHKYI